MTYRAEFPDFPQADVPPIPAEWDDESWHNDTCPSWCAGKGPNEEWTLRVFVDYPDVAMREIQSGHRFTVLLDCYMAATWSTLLLDSDDWDAVLRLMAACPREGDWKAVKARCLALKWVNAIGMGFHPDTSGADYSPAMTEGDIAQYDEDIAEMFTLSADPYADGLAAMQALFPEQFQMIDRNDPSPVQTPSVQPTLGYVSRLDTRNFSFEAHGATEDEAHETMGRLLAAHGRQYALAPDWADQFLDEIITTPFAPGSGWRDREAIAVEL